MAGPRTRYGTEWVLAAAMTAYTLGALGGALVIARRRPRSQGRAAFAGLAVYGFAPLSLMLPVHPAAVVAAYAVAGIGIELFNVPWFTATQREVAPDKRPASPRWTSSSRTAWRPSGSR